MSGRTDVRRWLLLALAIAMWASSAAAQTNAGIAGTVRDESGAVLPGVTVEASSPALIEKFRSAVTDGEGRYNIVDLRPGTYAVTFTIAGFSPVRREGIELSAGFTAAINASLKVGGVAETITVTGASPVVDVQNARTQQVMKLEVLEALPSGGRDLTQFAALTLGASPSTGGRNDVGGALADTNTGITIHGGRGDDGKVNYDGMNTNMVAGDGGGQGRIWKFNTMGVQETVVDTGGATAETEGGGANVNMIPRDGGNKFTVRSVVSFTNDTLSSSHVPDELIARGSAPTQNSLKKVYDYGVGSGGAILQDRLWFYAAARFWGSQSFAANNYFNKSAVFYRYEPDLSRPAYTDQWQRDVGGRFTWQATAKNKLATSLNGQRACGCWLALAAGAPQSPEAATSYEYGPGHGMWLSQTSWSYPATNRLLFQAGASFLFQSVAYTNDLTPGTQSVPITELTTGYTWGALPGAFQGGSYDHPHDNPNFSQRASISYVTGSHAVKAGIQTMQANADSYGDAVPSGANYVFRSGVPLSITQWATPFVALASARSLGLYLQDQWSVSRLTLTGGIRFDHQVEFARASVAPAGPFVGQRSYQEVDDLPNYKDITPRVGASYDVFGNGQTAVKGFWGRYLVGMGAGDARALAPAATVIQNTTRLWNDGNGNFVPDCELTNLGANGECGAVANPAFGQAGTFTRWDDSARLGWGVRQYSYQMSLGLQHEIVPGVGATIAYYHNDWKNQQTIVNTALTPLDFTPFCITAPTDPRLGSVSGQQVCGLYDQNPAKFGLVNNVRMLAKDVPGINGLPQEQFNGVDMGLNARFAKGGLMTGGVTVGRTTFDYCYLNALPNVSQANNNAGSGAAPAGLPRTEAFCKIQSSWWNGVGSQVKFQASYPLPWEFNLGAVYKNVPGIADSALYNATNAQTLPSLGRDLAACRGVVPCTATVPVQLLPAANNSGDSSAFKYDDRVNQLDLRLARIFKVNTTKLQGVLELYNVFNDRPAQGIISTYGAAWLRPTAFLGGRLFKFGAQVDW